MIDFDLLAIASTIVMVLSVLGITISATLLINDPPSSQVLKVWRLNIKHAGRDTLMEIMYKVMKVFESQKEGIKQKVYDDKMLRLKMDESYTEMKSRLDKQLAMGLSVSSILLLLGMMTLQICLFQRKSFPTKYTMRSIRAMKRLWRCSLTPQARPTKQWTQ